MCTDDAEAARKRRIDGGFDEPHLAHGLLAPAITWHTDLTCVIPQHLWTVSGSTVIAGAVPLNFPATMTVIRDGDSLVLLNALRFPDAVTAQVLALAGDLSAPVHIVRLGGYHGAYDSFWVAELGARARLWAPAGCKMQDGLVVDEVLGEGNLPLADAGLFEFGFGRPEAVLVLREERFAVFCDAVLNINSFAFVKWYAAPVVWALGFRSAVNRNDWLFNGWCIAMVGKEKVRGEYVRMLEECDFDGYSSGHGPAMIGGAREKIREAMKVRLR